MRLRRTLLNPYNCYRPSSVTHIITTSIHYVYIPYHHHMSLVSVKPVLYPTTTNTHISQVILYTTQLCWCSVINDNGINASVKVVTWQLRAPTWLYHVVNSSTTWLLSRLVTGRGFHLLIRRIYRFWEVMVVRYRDTVRCLTVTHECRLLLHERAIISHTCAISHYNK